MKLRVNLASADDALYVGSLYLGAPHGQQARVIFDTGSEHLAVTGSLCNNKTAGRYHFSQDSSFSTKINLEFIETAAVDDDDLKIEENKDPLDKIQAMN